MTNKKHKKNQFRSNSAPDLSTRAFSIEPKSIDEKARTVEAILATESPVDMWDAEYGRIPEVLRMDGCIFPDGGTMPLLDSHRVSSISNVLGSCRNLKPEKPNLTATLHFSSDEDGERALQKVKGGHLRDLSIGYMVHEFAIVPPGQTQLIRGEKYSGPCRVATSWSVFEGTLTPIGADSSAKVREKNGIISGSGAGANKNGGRFKMNPKLLELLFSRGLAQGSTSEEALAFFQKLSAEDQKQLRAAAGLDTTATTQTRDPEAEKRAAEEGQKREAARQIEIRQMAKDAGFADLGDELVKDFSCTVEQARAKIFERMVAEKKPVGTRVTAIADETDKFRAAADDGMSLRAGIAVKNPAPGASEIRGMSLVRFAEECLLRAGKQHRFSDPSEMITRAMTTTDFPLILANSANKKMQQMYLEADETWMIWAEEGEGRDFKDMTRAKMSESPALALVRENGEANAVAFSEFAPAFSIQTYDAEATLTRQMVINDDLSAFLKIPMAFGRAAMRKIGDLVYYPITNNSTLKSLGAGSSESAVALFHASHANLMTPAQALGFDGLKEMRRMFRVQTGLKSVALGLKMAYLLVPAALETDAEMLVLSSYIPKEQAGPIDNPFKGRAQVVAEHRLDANSTTAWYGIVDYRQSGVDTVEVAFLNGQRMPVMQTYEGNNPDVRKFRCRLDVGVGLKDHRGFQKSAGA